jgi:formamidopyrimidine-DNA glycosylase
LLWRIKINPNTPAKECLDKIPIICDTLVEIFEEAIEMRGSSVVDFAGGSYQNVLKAYGRVGEPCYRCDTKIERIVQAGRSTFFCPQCQR